MEFTIFTSKSAQNAKNCIYPVERIIKSKADLVEALRYDQVFAKYNNNYRLAEGFLWTNVIPQDCDNDESEDSKTWNTAEILHQIFIDVKHVIVPSRNNMVPKNGKKPRPKNHIFFPVDKITDAKEYEKLKAVVQERYPFFDSNAIDVARFFFASNCREEDIIWHDADKSILDVINEYDPFDDLPDHYKDKTINEGSRNSTLSKFAARMLIKYGDSDEAAKAFNEEAEKCNPPLEKEELDVIWNSAKKFYNKKVLTNPDYVTPEKYNDDRSYRPEDFTDLGQATVLKNTYETCLRYSPSTKFLVYTNGYWQESEEKAQRLVQKLTDKQLKEALTKIANLNKKLENGGVFDVIATLQKGENLQDKISKDLFNDVHELETNKQYLKFVYKRRDSKYISATLKEVRPIVEIMPSELNKNPYLLNTPSGTFDLRKGLGGFSEHKAEDYITKITTVSPGNKGKDIWLDCLDKIYGDAELIDYVQKICGLAVIGKVFIEAMIIAYGDGGNGKSTFWNAIFRVLGNYSGKLSADALTTSVRRNVKPEMAEMAGRRLLIASESQEGARLNESMIKQLCSTDEVMAEKKYKDPFYFTPTHMLVLYTNHLPRISGSDDGIWRRLIVIPYTRKLTGKDDIKNYADYLYENAGEYILSWLIDGAKKVIDSKFRIAEPKVVTDAIREYKEQSNWFNHFIEDCCEVGKGYEVSSSQLYSSYRAYCSSIGEYPRSTSDFYTALEKNGFKKEVKKRIKYIKGLKLIDSTVTDFEEFLT